ncbi:ankyrin repeat domain-containing protein [Planctomycetaceae bacterium SH139]
MMNSLRSLTLAVLATLCVHQLSCAPEPIFAGEVDARLKHDDQARLADALRAGDFARANTLLDQGVAIDEPLADGMSSLHWAVFHAANEAEAFSIVQRLIASGAAVDAKNRYGVTPLTIACTNGDVRAVEVLLTAGANPNAELSGGETALLTAARTGVVGSVKALLAHGADFAAKDRKGQTAMMWAAAEGHVEVVDVLIKAGADYRQPLRSGFTPFFFAVRNGKAAVVRRFLEAGVDCNDVIQPQRRANQGPQAGLSPLLLAIENGHFELALLLLEAGADPNDDRGGYTALHAISWVRKPLRGDGTPPPIGSGKIDSMACVRGLLAHGANVNALHPPQKSGSERLNKTAATPLLLAAETGDVVLMQQLLDAGADPRLTNIDQCTPLLAAAGVGVLGDGDESAGTEQEAVAAVKLLLDLGGDINAVDARGNSAMHGAAYKSWTQMLEFLAAQGADPHVWNRKNKRGWTPLMIAEGNRPGNFRPSQETIDTILRLLPEPAGD